MSHDMHGIGGVEPLADRGLGAAGVAPVNLHSAGEIEVVFPGSV